MWGVSKSGVISTAYALGILLLSIVAAVLVVLDVN